jgi:hypothetical protein
MLFGETYTKRSAGDIPAVRFYKGKPVPWIVHDCDETNSCRFCRRQKREFAKSLSAPPDPLLCCERYQNLVCNGACKEETPAVHFEGRQTLCPVCERNYTSGDEACDH